MWPSYEDAGRLEHERQDLDRRAALIGRALLSPFCSLLQ
jgi:hypothetical protein